MKRNYDNLIGETFVHRPLFGLQVTSLLAQPHRRQLSLFPMSQTNSKEILMHFDALFFVSEVPQIMNFRDYKNGIAAVACKPVEVQNHEPTTQVGGSKIKCSN
jgi:hypothetical protein